MIALSLLIFSIGFLLYAISPSYANTNEEKINASLNSPNDYEGGFYVSSKGYLFVFEDIENMFDWAKNLEYNNGKPYYKWIGNELYKMDEDGTKFFSRPRGYKRKLT